MAYNNYRKYNLHQCLQRLHIGLIWPITLEGYNLRVDLKYCIIIIKQISLLHITHQTLWTVLFKISFSNQCHIYTARWPCFLRFCSLLFRVVSLCSVRKCLLWVHDLIVILVSSAIPKLLVDFTKVVKVKDMQHFCLFSTWSWHARI